MKFLRLNLYWTIISASCIWVLAGSYFAESQSNIYYLEAKPEKGEGIYRLLRRFGLKANSFGYKTFTSLNNDRMNNDNALYPDISYKLPIVVVSFEQSYDTILEKFSVLGYKKEIFYFNKNYNPSFDVNDIKIIPDGQMIYIPEIRSGFYEDYENGNKQIFHQKELSLPYPAIKKVIQKGKLSTYLKNYCFILD